MDRAFTRRDKVMARLGVTGPASRLLFKPRGMHEATWQRLRHEAIRAEEEALGFGWQILNPKSATGWCRRL
jgi:hypothetical protein